MTTSDEDMERLLLRHFINDDWAARGSQSVESIFDRIGRTSGWRGAYFDKLHTPFERGALSSILERMAKDGLLKVTYEVNRADKQYDDPYYEAAYDVRNHPRFKHLYDNNNSPDALNSNWLESDSILDKKSIQSAIKSSNWTGLSTKMTPENLEIVKEKSSALLSAIMQSEADLQSRLDACKRIEAVIIVLDAPNVPWLEVVGLLNHPTVTALFAGLNILQFLIALAAH